MTLSRQRGKINWVKWILFYFALLQVQDSALAKRTDGFGSDAETPEAKFLLRRILRDITGQYHPELHGDHAAPGQGHFHAIHVHQHDDGGGHSHGVSGSSISASSSSFVDGNNEVHHHEQVVSAVQSPSQALTGTVVQTASSGYAYPLPPVPLTPIPPPPVQEVENGPSPIGAANCGCVQNERCAESQKEFTNFVISTRGTTLVCGKKYELCCFDDPWPGVVDAFQEQALCVPVEECAQPYGISATDVRDYGVIGPCPGLGSVRCLDGKVPIVPSPPQQPEGPIHFIIPIIDHPKPPGTYFLPEPPVPTTVYEPPVVYNPPAPVTQPPVVYNPPVPVTEPPVVYNPPAPVTEPTVVYNPPAPVTEPTVIYNPPAPVTEPSVFYGPPAPVPEPPTLYSPPSPVTIPSTFYAPPTPVIPPTSYGVPYRPVGRPIGLSGGYGYPYGGFGYGGFGGFPGFGFRKRLSFSKRFGLFG